MPSIGFIACRYIFSEGNIGIFFDRDVVVIVENDEVAQLLGSGEGTGFTRNTLFEITIGGNNVDVMVKGGLAGWCCRIKKSAFSSCCHRHANGGCKTLAKWT